jgi:hypothetical protein
MYNIATIKQTCYACPSQWEGKTEDGKDIYIRFRWGTLRLDIDGKTIISMEIGEDEWNGLINLGDVLYYLKNYIMASSKVMEEYYRL